LDSAFVLESP